MHLTRAVALAEQTVNIYAELGEEQEDTRTDDQSTQMEAQDAKSINIISAAQAQSTADYLNTIPELACESCTLASEASILDLTSC